MSPRKSPRLESSEKDTEVAHLREQVRLLTEENERLRRFIADNDITGALQPETVDFNNVGQREKRSTQRFTKTKSLSTPPRSGTPRAPGRGCSCKGNCSTKICGCVKRNIPCAEFCRCGDELCQNSEPDKENIGDPNREPQLSEDAAASLTKLSKLALAEGKESEPKHLALEPTNDASETAHFALQPVNKRLKRLGKSRGLFSPDCDGRQFTFEEKTEAETANISLRFGDAPEIGEAEEETAVEEVSDKKKNKNKKTKKEKNGKKKGSGDKNVEHRSETAPAENVITPIEDKKAAALVVPGFDPMKPRSQLSRSPVVQKIVPRIEQVLDASEVPLPAPLNEEFEEEPPEPEELKQDVVEDWDRHMANLVECTKCGRKLYPHRIKKHEASCQKI